MNNSRLQLMLPALLCWSVSLNAQTITSADDYFNKAGRQYVKEDKSAALRTLDMGLQHYPGDPRLLKLAEELLKDEQQKQQQQQKQQEQQQQEQQQKEQQKQEQQREQEEKERKQEQQEQQTQEKEPDPKDMRPQPGRIAPQDAKRILDALERGEKDVQLKVRERQQPARRVPVEKDW